jgi:hypothetical protein
VAGLDSIVIWEELIAPEELKALVDARSFPEDLRGLIQNKLSSGEPIRNLGQYDSLSYKLIRTLKAQFAGTTGARNAALDANVQWTSLVGENRVMNLVDVDALSRPVRRSTLAAVREGKPVQTTEGWETLYPAFYEQLQNTIRTAEETNVWEKENLEIWQEMKHAEWEADLDTRSAAEQDSLWAKNQREMWDKEKEIAWKEDSKQLWKNEKETWPKENESLWASDVSRKWEADRKKIWMTAVEEDQKERIALWLAAQKADTIETDGEVVDSTLTAVAVDTVYEADTYFKKNSDDIWRDEVDAIRAAEYDSWLAKNQKYVQEVIESMWQNDRRVTWEEEGYAKWLEEKNKDKAARWVELKEALWMSGWMELWKDEEVKLARKNSAIKKLDLSVNWAALLSADQIESIVNELDLPDNSKIWQKLTMKTDTKGSKLYQSGLVPLFRDELIGSVSACPVAEVPYLIHVQDTSTIKRVSITCPISTTHDRSVGEYKYPVIQEDVVAAESDTTTAAAEEKVEVAPKSSKSYTVALKVDPVTRDTTKIQLKLPSNIRLFGGGTIRNHGNIDEDGKKSWQKKGR